MEVNRNYILVFSSFCPFFMTTVLFQVEVTALGPNKTIASYASYGNEVDIAVRGKWVSMITHDRTATKEASMAAAAITGLAATLYAKNSAATYHEVKRCILNTALTEPSWPKGLVKCKTFISSLVMLRWSY